jgi:hypothetical protein
VRVGSMQEAYEAVGELHARINEWVWEKGELRLQVVTPTGPRTIAVDAEPDHTFDPASFATPEPVIEAAALADAWGEELAL